MFCVMKPLRNQGFCYLCKLFLIKSIVILIIYISFVETFKKTL